MEKYKTIIDSLIWDQNSLVPELSYAGVAVYQDEFPVTDGHLIFVPLTNDDSGLSYCFNRALRVGKELVANGKCDGFNIGLNYNKAAGQTIRWPCLHLIPRRTDDVKTASGGVRAVIPALQNWLHATKYAKARKSRNRKTSELLK